MIACFFLQAYYVENINAGLAEGAEALHQVTSDLLHIHHHHNRSDHVPVCQVSLSQYTTTELESLLDKLRTATKGETPMCCYI